MSPTTMTSTSERWETIDDRHPPWPTNRSPAMSPTLSRPKHSPSALTHDRTKQPHLAANPDLTTTNPPLTSPSTPIKDDITPYLPHQPKSLSGIALRAFCLGTAFSLGLLSTLAIYLLTTSPLWRLPFFLTSLALFHFLEFWITAACNTRAADVSSFLLTSNGAGYFAAHSVATLECLVTNLLWPGARWVPFGLGPALTWIGFGLVVVGQVARSVAMVHAGRSFNHIVQYRKQSGHVLVTDGVYSLVRHPSYFGFFWWALGTQLVMGNVLSFCGYAGVLWRFFSRRIAREEVYLVGFFGEEYEAYRRRVPAGIPFVR